jgi:hypothetical protein
MGDPLAGHDAQSVKNIEALMKGLMACTTVEQLCSRLADIAGLDPGNAGSLADKQAHCRRTIKEIMRRTGAPEAEAMKHYTFYMFGRMLQRPVDGDTQNA